MNRFIVPADAKSWIPVDAESDFPIQNLPFGVASRKGEPVVVTRIGDTLIDVELAGFALELDAVSPQELSIVRQSLYEIFCEGSENRPEYALFPAEGVSMLKPIRPPAFIDFYSGIYHAGNVGRMFRPDQPPLLPNYRHLPVGYNGRASTVVVSGTDIVRPQGQTKAADAESPTFGPTKELDFELELGFFTGLTNPMGQTIAMDQVDDYMLGLVLVNDWSARDVQRWEYQPLGPFLAKSFATSISPWIVTFDALEPFRIAGEPQSPSVLPHLESGTPRHYDLELTVCLKTAKMTEPQVISQSNARYLYWSFAQQLVHQASNGTLVEAGDLYASGTISGPERNQAGSFLELTWRGTEPLVMAETGEERRFLEDGDTLSMRAVGLGNGFRVGFGEVSGTVVASCV